MAMSIDEVFELLTSELRAAGYHLSPTESVRMRAFLAELDAAKGKKPTGASPAGSWAVLRQSPASR